MIRPAEAGCGDRILCDAALSIQGSEASTYPTPTYKSEFFFFQKFDFPPKNLNFPKQSDFPPPKKKSKLFSKKMKFF